MDPPNMFADSYQNVKNAMSKPVLFPSSCNADWLISYTLHIIL